MKYENLTKFNDGEFKRLVGVPRPLFLKMVSVLQHAELAKKKSGRPHSLCLEDQLLLTLNYLRCYRDYVTSTAKQVKAWKCQSKQDGTGIDVKFLPVSGFVAQSCS